MDTRRHLLETPLGWIAAVARSGHLIATSLPQPTSKEAIADCRVEAADGPPDDLLAALAEDFRRYVAGLPVDFTGYLIDVTDRPPFHRRALLAARRIPYGQVRTYGWLAKKAGRPRAARAAGQAMST
ncbi:MAG: MGMT family protein, partial [Armatimonadetes bacterium]|nr:MGMT family protein [Armatimonadota bacterium]